MELHGKGFQVGVVDALAGAVVGVGEGQAAGPDAVGVHGVAVVLAGDEGADAVHVPDGLIDTPVAVFQLVGLAAHGQGRQLVAQSDAEHGDLAQELFDLRDLIDVFRRISGAIGQHDAIGV